MKLINDYLNYLDEKNNVNIIEHYLMFLNENKLSSKLIQYIKQLIKKGDVKSIQKAKELMAGKVSHFRHIDIFPAKTKYSLPGSPGISKTIFGA